MSDDDYIRRVELLVHRVWTGHAPMEMCDECPEGSRELIDDGE